MNLFRRGFFYYFFVFFVLLCFVVALFFGVLTWRLSRGSVDVSFLESHFISFIDSRFENVGIVLGGIDLARESDGDMRFLLRDVRLTDDKDSLLVGVPAVSVGFDGFSLLLDFFGFGGGFLQSLHFSGVNLLVRRSVDGRISLGFGDFSDGFRLDSSTVPSFATLGSDISDYVRDYMSDEVFLGGLGLVEGVSILDSSIVFFDEANETIWRLRGSNLIFDRFSGGIEAVLTADLLADSDDPLRIESTFSYSDGDSFFDMRLRVFDVVPSALSDNVRIFSTLARMDTPLSGGALMRFDLDGRLVSLKGDLRAGKGFIDFPGMLSDRLFIEDGSFAFSYDGSVIRLSSGRINTGLSWLDFSGTLHSISRRFDDLFFDVSFSVGRHDRFSAAPPIESLFFSGRAFPRLGRVEFEDIVLRGGPSMVRMDGVIEGGDLAPSIYLSGDLSDVSRDMFLTLWPSVVAPSAKSWFESHVSASVVKTGEFMIDLPEVLLQAAMSGDAIPDESIYFSFLLEDVVSRYYYDFPPIRDASMTGYLRGTGLDITLHEGKVYGDFVALDGRLMRGPVFVNAGRLSVNRFSGADRFLDISFSVSDDTGSIFPLIDRAPLQFLSHFGLSADRMGGDVSMSLSMRVPILLNNRLGSPLVTGVSEIESFSYVDIFRDFSVSDGRLDLEITPDLLALSGDIFVSDVRGSVDWRSALGGGGLSEDGDKFTVRARLDEAAQSRLGLSLEPIFSGPVSAELSFSFSDWSGGGTTDSSALSSSPLLSPISVRMDMSASEMVIDALDWSRPAGTGLDLDFDLLFSDSGLITLRDVTIAGDDVFIFGTVILDGSGILRELHFPTVSLGDLHHLSFDGLRGEDDVLFISSVAKKMDLRPILQSLFRRRSGSDVEDSMSSVEVALSIDDLVGFNGMSFKDSRINAVYDKGLLQSLLLEGRLGESSSVSLGVSPNGGDRRVLSVRTDDGGSLLRLLGIYTRMSGGRLTFVGDLGGRGESALLGGDLTLTDFTVFDEPVLANLDLGGDLSSGIVFDNLALFFDVDESDIYIRTARAGGPSICVFSNGRINKASGALDLAGTFIPACSLNAALGTVPILGNLGEILLGGKQQGLIGVTFGIGGTMVSPSFSVNPLSPLAPGFMRRFFEFQPSSPISDKSGSADSGVRDEDRGSR